MVTDVHNTGKGYAFVTFEEKEAAENAIREMDGATVNGQQIKVNEAKPREGGRGGGRGGYGGGFGGGRGGGGKNKSNQNQSLIFHCQATEVVATEADVTEATEEDEVAAEGTAEAVVEEEEDTEMAGKYFCCTSLIRQQELTILQFKLVSFCSEARNRLRGLTLEQNKEQIQISCQRKNVDLSKLFC